MPNKNPFYGDQIILRTGLSEDLIKLDDGTTIVDKDGNIDAPVTTTDLTTTGNTTLGSDTSDTITINAKMQNNLYWNLSGSSGKTIKAHNHSSTSTINAEFKYDYAVASGSGYGIYNEAYLKTTGTGTIFGALNLGCVATGVTATNTTVIGCYGQARADGTITGGSSLVAGLYGIVGESGAITASHVCSAWLDSHQASAVTGEHELLYMTNNAAAVMDQAIFLYPGNKITHLLTIDPTDTGLVDDATGETLTPTKKINVKIDGTTLVMYAGTSA